jgi:hypothetical protein
MLTEGRYDVKSYRPSGAHAIKLPQKMTPLLRQTQYTGEGGGVSPYYIFYMKV